MDDGFSDRQWTKTELLGVTAALATMVDKISTEYRMTETERSSFARIIHRRMGLGVRLAGFASWLPAPLFRAAFFILSPRLSSRFRRASSAAHSLFHELRHPILAVGGRLPRWTR